MHLALGAAALSAPTSVANAEAYPARPVRVIVGYTPAGVTDLIARVIGQWLAEKLGQPFIIDNRPGAGANIGTETVVRATPDGYTLLLINSADTINATLYQRLNFSFLHDIVPIAGIARQPQVMLVHASVPAKTLPELITYARANPGKITMASPGKGTIGHLSGEMLKAKAGVDLLHVPYRGAAPALTDLLPGHVHLLFTGIAGAIEHVRSGSLHAFAVTTTSRSEAIPSVPAMNEFVAGYEATSLFGIGAPRNTASMIVRKLNEEVNAALANANITARVAELGGTVLPGSPHQFAEILAHETAKWGDVIRVANIAHE
jgi:tripartite-type tricarboxylate transporter receptor subunit TctC